MGAIGSKARKHFLLTPQQTRALSRLVLAWPNNKILPLPFMHRKHPNNTVFILCPSRVLAWPLMHGHPPLQTSRKDSTIAPRALQNVFSLQPTLASCGSNYQIVSAPAELPNGYHLPHANEPIDWTPTSWPFDGPVSTPSGLPGIPCEPVRIHPLPLIPSHPPEDYRLPFFRVFSPQATAPVGPYL